MHQLLNPLMVVLLFVLVRAADLAISAGISRDFVRAVAYGIVALVALIVVILALV